MISLRVDLDARGYDVVVEDSFARLAQFVAPYRRIAVVTDANVDAAWGSAARDALGEPQVFVIQPGEDAKTPATVAKLCEDFASFGLLRADAIVALGGGVVGDVAGFAAAVYYRGIDVVQAPTTLLAMVDSAIGGKTGVNLPQGKNLVGAFHQPRAVFANPRVLDTLPDREYRCGLGEVAKYELMEGDVVGDPAPVLARDARTLTDVVAKCAAIKARYVEADEFERSGVRAVLNYGHTVAHALETATGHALLHGEAVAVGLVFAGQLAGALERIDQRAVARHEEVVAALGLPVVAPSGLRADDLLPIMARDKKSGGTLTFVLAGPSGIERVDDPDPAAVRKAFAAIGVEA
jgi:5-deoxy-5-amino-3-dehydroquinate synthase